MQLLTERDTAKLMKYSVRHLRTLRRMKLLPYLQIRRSIRYDLRDVEAALKRLKVAAIE
jgi:hypothetical protein